jgi:hypothetical protein
MTLSIIVSKVDDLDGRRNLIMAALQIAPTKTADSSERICVQQKFKRRRSVVWEFVRVSGKTSADSSRRRGSISSNVSALGRADQRCLAARFAAGLDLL